MFRIILIITLILIAIPFFNKAKDYVGEKIGDTKAIAKTAKKVIKYTTGNH